MKNFLALALVSLAFFTGNGCTTHPSGKPATVSSPAQPAAYLTVDQEAELRSRLDKLAVGMSRDKVLEIINLDSFNLHPFAYANNFGLTYRFPKKHALVISFNEGDYADTLGWVKFDNEVWPRNNRLRRVPAK